MQRAITVLSIGLFILVVARTAQANDYKTQHHSIRVETLFEDLHHPWGLAFLPDGQMLVTEQVGRLNLLNPINGEAIQKFLALIPLALPEHPKAGSSLVGEGTNKIQKIPPAFLSPRQEVR